MCEHPEQEVIFVAREGWVIKCLDCGVFLGRYEFEKKELLTPPMLVKDGGD